MQQITFSKANNQKKTVQESIEIQKSRRDLNHILQGEKRATDIYFNINQSPLQITEDNKIIAKAIVGQKNRYLILNKPSNTTALIVDFGNNIEEREKSILASSLMQFISDLRGGQDTNQQLRGEHTQRGEFQNERNKGQLRDREKDERKRGFGRGESENGEEQPTQSFADSKQATFLLHLFLLLLSFFSNDRETIPKQVNQSCGSPSVESRVVHFANSANRVANNNSPLSYFAFSGLSTSTTLPQLLQQSYPQHLLQRSSLPFPSSCFSSGQIPTNYFKEMLPFGCHLPHPYLCGGGGLCEGISPLRQGTLGLQDMHHLEVFGPHKTSQEVEEGCKEVSCFDGKERSEHSPERSSHHFSLPVLPLLRVFGGVDVALSRREEGNERWNERGNERWNERWNVHMFSSRLSEGVKEEGVLSSGTRSPKFSSASPSPLYSHSS